MGSEVFVAVNINALIVLHSEDDGNKFLHNAIPLYQATLHHIPEDCSEQ
jgi:hypothetical protein